MANEGATQFGSIKAVLTLDKSDYVRGLLEAGAQADELGRHDPTIRVDVDGVPAAITQLKAADRQVQKLNDTTQRTHGRTRALVAAVALLGPALVPIGTAAIGVAAALGGMGAAGVLAVLGIKQEMEAGTKVGLEFESALDDGKEALTSLSRTAAGRVLQPFQVAVQDLRSNLPALNDQVGELATVTGSTARAGVSGLVAGFIALRPLILDASLYVKELTERFERAMLGPGMVSFVDYARSSFPQIVNDIESIVAAVGHLVAGFAPLGLGTLSMLGTLSDLIRLIPTDVLATVAQLAASVYLGFKTWQGLDRLVGGLADALAMVGIQGGRAATALRGLQIASGVIGVALAGLSWIVSRNAEATREQQARVDDLTDAFKASHGAIDQVIRDHQYLTLQQAGAIDAAKRLGIGLDTVTQASLGNAAALAEVNGIIEARIRANQEEAKASTQVSYARGNENKDLRILKDALGGANAELVAGQQGYQDYANATQQATTATSAAATEAQRLAGVFGVSAPTYEAAASQQQEIASKAAAATLQMQLENDAAGLLKQALDLLNGETLTYEQALNGFERAQLAVGRATRDSEGAIDKSKTTLKGNSDAAVTNRGNLLQLATQASLTAEAFGAQSNSSEAGRKKLMELRDQIIKNAAAQGLNTKEVQAFIDKILKIPSSVPPTKVDVDKAEASRKLSAFQAQINGLRGKTVTITSMINYVTKGDVSLQAARNRMGIEDARYRGGPIPGYAGGTIVGPGTGTSDSILAMVRESGRLLRVSNGEFVSTARSTQTNRAALEAGNRGAQLQVAGQQIDMEWFEVLFMRLIAELRRNPLKASLTTGQLNSAMGAMLK